MSICLEFDPSSEPWLVPYDTRDTSDNPEPDGRISTYDIEAIPHALSRYSATPVWVNTQRGFGDEKLCDAFSNEMVKLRFFNEIIRPLAGDPASVWQQKSYWEAQIMESRSRALYAINERQEDGDGRPKMADDVYECDWMGTCVENSFASAKAFVNCAADEAFQSLSEETPILAGVGIVLKKEQGQFARISHTLIPYPYYYFLEDYAESGLRWGPYIASIDGRPTKSMTEEEMAAALSGSQGTYVNKMEFAELVESHRGEMCSAEPRVTGGSGLRRTLAMGDLMTRCGGIDLRVNDR